MDNQSHNNQEQEVDLVPVFVWISNGFKSLFTGIGNIFKGIAHFLILFLIFIKNNVILLGVLFLLGGALGFYWNTENKKTFTAQLRVQPNFESASQLISNLEHYNSLVDQKDSVSLAKEIGITPAQAGTLKSFDIKADYNDTELLQEYDELARKSDTMALDNFTFDGFKNAKRDLDYEFYKVQISGTDRNTIEQSAHLMVQVKDNPVIKALRLSSVESNLFNIKDLESQLTGIDSLIGAYQVAIKTSNTQNQASTNVFMSEKGTNTTFNDLYYQRSSILKRLQEEREDKYSFANTVNISSYFVKKGAIEKQHYTLKFAFIFLGLGFIIALIPMIFKFLNNYQTKVKG